MIKFKLVKVETMKGELIEFSLKNIIEVSANILTIKRRYRDWLRDGQVIFKLEYEITPESLSYLLTIVEGTKLEKKFNFGSAKALLKMFPTKELLNEYYEKIDQLPKI